MVTGSAPHPLAVGTAPVNWNNFDLEGWRDPVPFPALLDRMVEAGYRGTEWDQSFGHDPGILNRERTARGMTFMGAYRWLDFVDARRFARDLNHLRQFLPVLATIGVRHLIVADRLRPERIACAGAVPADGSLSLDPPAYAEIAGNLAELAIVALEHGLVVHYHNHVGTWIETPVELDRLVHHIHPGTIDLCFDTGHYAYGGGNPLDFIKQNLARIGYLHLKDVDAEVLAQARREGWSFLEALRHIIFCPLGAGSAQIPETIRHLVARRFTGWVIIEQDTCQGDATVNARANLETVRRLERLAPPDPEVTR